MPISGDSFLPLMLKDARNAGIMPVFIRTKYRSQARGEADSPELAEYMTELRDYIQQNGGLLVDYGRSRKIDCGYVP